MTGPEHDRVEALPRHRFVSREGGLEGADQVVREAGEVSMIQKVLLVAQPSIQDRPDVLAQGAERAIVADHLVAL